MLDENDKPTNDAPKAETPAPRRRAAGRPAGPPAALSTDIFAAPVAPAKKAKVADKPAKTETPAAETGADVEKPAKKTTAKKAAKKAPAKKTAGKPAADQLAADQANDKPTGDETLAMDSAATIESKPARRAPLAALSTDIFAAPDPSAAPPRKRAAKKIAEPAGDVDDIDDDQPGSGTQNDDANRFDDDDDAPRRRRRSRGGRRRRKSEDGDDQDDDNGSGRNDDDNEQDADGNPTLRRRRRRRAGEDAGTSPDDPENTTVRVREPRNAEDEITGVTGSTRLEAKKQRRREGREAGRRRAPIVSEAEFLARRESVKREMAIRQYPEYSQIAVLEDNVLVEHYVARESQTSLIGNVYLGKVQNVLPSMEAAFVDIGKGRNAVLYAGEVDWTTLGNGKQRKIEDVLSSGQTVLVQVTKDPIGQKGARLTSQISLAGRFLVYVPGGQTSGISRKLPDTERTRLKNLLKEVLPEDAGVIVRTAAEGATEDQLTRDVSALTARWEDIQRKVEAGNSPELLYAEPDLMIKVVRDLFNEDFNRLVVEGDDAWDMISAYINHVAPDLTERLERFTPENGKDVFNALRVDEQISKALDRKVWLPSGGSLVIDRTEAMTVVDVNTGKFTGSGGNLEETVTKNNLEAAEEIVRQLRLRDIGGIIVIDFIDMVLEGNRDLVLRRLVECLGRDRTRHQVAEVTSLGLVQMTRKRIGTGLLESFSTDCEHCNGRGVVVQIEPVEPKGADDSNRRGGGNRRGGRGGNRKNEGGGNGGQNGNGGGQKNDQDEVQNEKAQNEKGESPQVDARSGNKSKAEDKPDANPAAQPDVTTDSGPEAKSETPAMPAPETPVEQSADKPAETPLETASQPEGAAPKSGSVQVDSAEADVVDQEKPEKTADVTENSVETPATDGPVLTSEGQAP